MKGGLQWGLPPAGFPPPGGPRRLVRIGFPTTNAASYQLLNYIAIEPVVKGVRGFSELENSALDRAAGKRLRAMGANAGDLFPGVLSRRANGVEELSVEVGVEPFDNGAKVYLTISQRSDAPDEIRLAVRAAAGSAQMEYCILTATMGNKARLRQVWLRDRVVSSRELYGDYTGPDFAPHHYFPLEQLERDKRGDVVAPASNDEADPASVFPFPGTDHWHFAGPKVTQYWKQSRDGIRDDLNCVVNGRFVYWKSHQPIPGGVALENFEFQERFYEGQEFIFGISRSMPRVRGGSVPGG